MGQENGGRKPRQEVNVAIQTNDTKSQDQGTGVGIGSKGATVRAAAKEEPVELNHQEQRDRSQSGAPSSGYPS